MCYNNSLNGIEHFVIVIQIRIVERRKGVPRNHRLKKGEVRKKDFFFKTKNKERKEEDALVR